MTQGKRSARSKIGYCFLALALGVVFVCFWGKHVVELVADQSHSEASLFFIRSNTSRMRIVMLVNQNAAAVQRANLAPLLSEVQSAANDNTQRIAALQLVYKNEQYIAKALADLDKLNSEFYLAWQKQQSPDDKQMLQEMRKREIMQAERFDHMRKDCAELSEATAKRCNDQLNCDMAIFYTACAALVGLVIFTSSQVKTAFYKRAMEEARG